MFSTSYTHKTIKFTLFWSVVPKNLSDLKRRIVQTSYTFSRLKEKILKWRDLSKATKVHLYNILIVPITTNIGEILKEEDKGKLHAFKNHWLTTIVKTFLHQIHQNQQYKVW